MGLIPNPWVMLGIGVAFILAVTATYFVGYSEGDSDRQAKYTKQELIDANATIKRMETEQAVAAKAGEGHDANIRTVTNETRIIERTVRIPPESDPFLPVGFVRLFDRAASRNIGADPYPGKSDGEASTVRVSEAATLLTRNFGTCTAYATQLSDLIAYMKAANEARETVARRDSSIP